MKKIMYLTQFCGHVEEDVGEGGLDHTVYSDFLLNTALSFLHQAS